MTLQHLLHPAGLRPLLFALAFGAIAHLSAGACASVPVPRAASAVQDSSATALSAADLEELLAPIALYPDALLATVLGACVYPDELMAAARAVKSGAGESQIDASNWEQPVKDLAKVPTVLDFLASNREWMVALGEAYVLQGQDVMTAVQSLRARAYANGSLQSTKEQSVEVQGDTIIIQPADPQIIYVPTYNPSVVYVDNSSSVVAAGVIGFGVGVAVGLALNCDWHHGWCCYGGWRGGYRHYGDVNINVDRNVNIDNSINVGDRNRPGSEGGRWEPNRDKVSNSLKQGRPTQLDNYRGAGSTRGSAGRVPGKARDSAPIASRPAPRPSTAQPRTRTPSTSRPDARATQRPSSLGGRATPTRGNVPTPTTRAPSVRSRDIPKPNTARPSGGGSRGAFDTSHRSRQAASNRGSSSRNVSRSSGGRSGGARPSRGGGRRR